MSVTITPFAPLDVVGIVLQSSQIGQFGAWEPVRSIAHGQELADIGPAWTVRTGDGDIVLCSGFGEIFTGVQATIWALFGEGFAALTLRGHAAVIRAMRERIAATPYRRIEAVARAAHPRECRLLHHLGFTERSALPCWGPQSEDYVLFDKVRG